MTTANCHTIIPARDNKHDMIRHMGDVIRHRRMLLSLTINDLATQSGISESCLAQVELGSRLASADVLDRIAGPLEYEKEDLFEIAG